MGLSQERQQKIDIKSSVTRIVLEIKDLTGKKSYEIAEALGVEPETISRGESEQLLKALNLLLEVEQLKRQPPPKTNRELILELTDRVAAIERGLRTVAYPKQRSTHYEMNDALISSDQFAEIAEVTAQKLLAAITSAAAPATTKHPPTTARPVEKDRP